MSRRYVVLDTGFGVGEHFLAVLQGAGGLHYIALLPALPDAHALPAALRAKLAGDWPVNVPGLHRLELESGEGGRVTLDLLVGPLETTLPQIDVRVDAFYLPEPIAPMRTLAKLALPGATLELRGADESALKALRSAGFEWRAEPMGAHAEAGPARAAQVATVSPMNVQATFTSRKPQPPGAAEPVRRAIVVGAGMAGAAACERLAARGWQVTLIERHALPAQEASGNRSGIFMPLLSKDDNIPTRLSRAAYLYAMRRWRALGGLDAAAGLPGAAAQADAACSAAAAALVTGAAASFPGAASRADAPGGAAAAALAKGGAAGTGASARGEAGPAAAIAGAQCGVLQLARDAEHAALQKEVAAAWNYPPEFVRWVDAGEAGGLLGAPTPDGGWLFSQGGWANPAAICRAMLDACGARLTRIFNAQALQLERVDGLWLVRAGDGALLASAPTVILANGAGALAIAQTAGLPLYTMRGQVTHLAQDDFPALPLVVCREAYLTPPVHGIVSVGATYDSDTDGALRDASQQENLSRARDILPGVLPHDPPLAGRVGLRCMAPDRLPLVGALPDHGATLRMERLRDVPRHAGLYGLLGYASRGLIWAPLAAEMLACQLEHEAPPLESTLAAALDPARFLLKARRGGRV